MSQRYVSMCGSRLARPPETPQRWVEQSGCSLDERSGMTPERIVMPDLV
jgi:hypothetical protein